VTSRIWKVRLSTTAKADVEQIVARSANVFGDVQARIYAETIFLALKTLEDGPDCVGVKSRPDIGVGLFTLHVARNRRRGRHIVLFRVEEKPEQSVIVVLRVLHDAMDPARHLPPDGV
jgi:toxin ParE1/3/4